MTDVERLPDPAPYLPHLPPASAIIVRHPQMDEAHRMAAALMPKARRYGVAVLLSAPFPPALLEADGIHIPEAALGRWKASDIARLNPALVTASAHSQRAVMTAKRRGVDAVLLSPVFPTRSHGTAASLGVSRFATIAGTAGLPVIALGGITEARIIRVLHAGASGLAGIGLFSPGDAATP
ncbi:thiamine phosphate synthase [Thalassospiraceae bacterium LMO-JJ14]|nr:thiamine phosphate synthase [Thalassospiraceae bacterium LMO-JJ14]